MLTTKKTLLALVCALFAVTCAGESGGGGTLLLGVRNSRYVMAGYELPAGHCGLELEHGLQAVNIKRQQVRASLFWHDAWLGGRMAARASAFCSTTWSGTYSMTGVHLSAAYSPLWRVTAELSVNPYYDTEYRWITAWSAGLRGALTRQAALFCTYTTVPDYRLSERRIHAGAAITVGNLSAEAAVSVPLSHTPAQSLRLLCSFRYRLPL